MGLDMYLVKKTDVKNWSFEKDNNKEVNILLNGKQHPTIKTERISQIVEDVGYWRKANQIHKWFVENIQNGEDDCKEYYVSDEKIGDLLNICKRVLASSVLVDGKIQNGQELKDGKWTPIMQDGKLIQNPEIADLLLPTENGFFFGSTDYDEYYIEDIKDTIEILEPLIKELEESRKNKIGTSIYYQSSW